VNVADNATGLVRSGAADRAPFDYVVFHYGGLGDLCLLSNLVASLKCTASARVGLICRSGLRAVTDLYPTLPDAIFGIDLNLGMWQSPSEGLVLALRAVVEQLSRIEVDTLFCADMNLPWFGWFVAAILRPRRAIAASRRPRPHEMVSPLLERFSLSEVALDGPPLPPTIHERERYASMLAYAAGVVEVRPAWVATKSALARARAWLTAEDLAQSRYLLTAPFGTSSNLTKRWPSERFEDVLAAASDRHGLAIVLAGDEPQREALSSLASRLSARSTKVATLVGSSTDLDLLAGLTAGADAYVGIDTGPAHLAQAYGVPAAIVFGGGSGQHYTPWGPGSVGVMQPIPCAGCLWDCAFGSPLCLDSVSSEELAKALDAALAQPDAAPTLRFLSPLPEPARSIIAGANQRYQAARTGMRNLAGENARLENENVELRDRYFRLRAKPHKTRLVETKDAKFSGQRELTVSSPPEKDVTFSSTGSVNHHFEAFEPHVRQHLNTLRNNGGMTALVDLIDRISDFRVLIVGDAIIDEYQYVLPMGKSLKETTISTRYRDHELFVGGVFAVANHVAALCKEVHVITCLGEFDSHQDLVRKSLRPNVGMTAVLRSGAPTTLKRRFVDPAGTRKLFEVYVMNDEPLSADNQRQLDSAVSGVIGDYDVVIAADFGHGMLARSTIDALAAARFLAVNAQSNVANLGYNLVTKYPRADYICIDATEARLALGDRISSISDIARRLVEKHVDYSKIIVTQGKHGCVAYERGGADHTIPAFAWNVVDTMGAGDAFLAVTSPLVAAGGPLDHVGFIGNVVGAIKVEIVGQRLAIDKPALIKTITELLT
jgi:ADP-heptose:LPS heptosyltransferase/sugar/nucleoside kinase (ribokinase family)